MEGITDKNDLDLIFKFCLEFKSHGDCLQWSHQEHRLKGMKAITACKNPQYAQKHVRCLREELGQQLPM